MSKYLYTVFVVLACSLALQSFECASPEFTSAKLALNQKDYLKARDLLEKVVAKNPNDANSWYLLANCRRTLLDYAGAGEAIIKAQSLPSDGVLRSQIATESYVIWVEVYNVAVNSFNQFQINRSLDTKRLKEHLKLGTRIKPENSELYALLGSVYETEGDTTNAIAEYNNYLNAQESAFNLAKEKGVSVGMSRASAIQQLGRPDSTKSTPLESGDSLYYDHITSGSQHVYLFSATKRKGPAMVEGWRVDLPKNWLPQERNRHFVYNVRPYPALALMYYSKKNYEAALATIEKASLLSPEDEQNAAFKLQIYEDQGRTNEILASLVSMTTKYPKNKAYMSQLAFIFSKLQRNDEAIATYEKTLEIDPTYDIALFNLAAAYKNKASEFQKYEAEKKKSNPKYKEDESKYFPLLNKASELFSRYLQLPQRTGDLAALIQIANIYEVTREAKKLDQTITQLESIEPSNTTNIEYYDFMGGIYARQSAIKKGYIEKSKAMYDKADALKKR
ncbi:MAG: tetratricopeptide repeat protein [Candidatus Kapaibacterium sp.]